MELLVAEAQWWGADWSSALLAIATSVLAVGVFITLLGLFGTRKAARESASARNTQVYTDISRRWDSDDLLKVRVEIDRMEPRQFRDAYTSLRESRLKFRQAKAFELKRLANFFEDLGVLESQGSLDVQWIEVAFGSLVTHYWKIWELGAAEERSSDVQSVPDAGLTWENWEALSKKMEERRIRSEGHHPKWWHRRKHF